MATAPPRGLTRAGSSSGQAARQPSACAAKAPPPQPIPALAEQRQCPAYPLPPAELIKPPVKTDFLNPTR